MPLIIPDDQLPEQLASLRFPAALEARLQLLLDRQDDGIVLTKQESSEAEALVEMAELLTMLKLQTERAMR
ncbi:MAG: hypothetical protein K2X38_18105 [Gemmataceae bacterium]|nr:hypothetical protein [Gemmataceae bacterium]